MTMFKHVLKRIALVVLGYFLAVLVGLIAVAVLYGVLSSLPGAPDYFVGLGMSPILMLLVPPIATLVYTVAIVLTAAQSLVFAILSEIFAIRNIAVHMLFGAVAGETGFVLSSPTFLDGIATTDWADLGVVAAASLVGGLVYWLVAGRDAGIRPRAVDYAMPL